MSAALPLAASSHGVLLVVVPAPAETRDGGSERAHAAAAAELHERARALLEEIAGRCGARLLARTGGLLAAAWLEQREDDRATVSAAAMLALRQLREGIVGSGEEPASLRIALGRGSIATVCVGDRESGSLDVVLGGAVHDAALALLRDPGSFAVVSPQVRAEASGVVAEPFGAGATSSPAPRAPLQRGGDDRWGESIQRATIVVARLDLRLDRAAQSPDVLGRMVAMVQRESAKAGGQVLAMLPVGSAPALLCAFGLGHASEGHHGARAIETALRIRRAAPRDGVGVRLGVATGPVLWRRALEGEATGLVVGDAVARALALVSSEVGAIACDAATRDEATDLYRFTQAGDGAQVSGARSYVVAAPASSGPAASGAAHGRLVGRDRELDWIRSRLGAPGGPGRLMAILGEAGMGKSALVERIAAEAAARSQPTLRAAGDPIAPENPFGAWRRLARSAIEGALASSDDPSGALREVVEDLGHEAGFAPLLAAVADVAMPETTRSASLSQAGRGAAIEQLLVSLLRRTARGGRPLVLLDDAHWIDTSSLQVILRAFDEGIDADVIVLSRPTSRAGAWTQLLAVADTLVLPELDADAGADLAGSLIGSHAISGSAAAWLRTIAGGNPLFLRELLQDAMQRGRLRVVSGTLESVPVQGADDSLASLEAVVERRVAALDEDARSLLCCASVIGAEIDLDSLDALVPARLRGEAGRDALGRLAAQGLVDASDATLRFHHELIRLAAYAMLPDALRRSLHRQVAERLAAGGGAPGSRRDALLGHHWEGAGCADRAARHYAAAAWRAVRDGGGAEGVSLYSLALAADDRAAEGRVTALERASWESHLAGAYWNIGDMSHAERCARSALARAGDRFPQKSSAYGRRMLVDALRVARWWKGSHADPSPEERERLLVCMGAARRLADSQYFVGDSTALLCACLAGTAHALRCKDLAPAVRAAGLVAYTAGLVGLTRFSDRLFARSLAAAQDSADPGAASGTIGAETMLRVGQGDWARAMPLVEQALVLCRRGLDSHDLGTALTLAGLANYFVGRFDPAAEAFRELHAMAVANRRDQHRAWARFALSQTMLPLGGAAEALPLLAEARELLIDLADNVSLMICRSVQAAAHVRLGDLAAAAEAAAEAARLAAATPPRNFGSLEGYAGPAEAFLALAAAADPASAERRRWLGEASRSLRPLRDYARLFPIGRPRLHLATGWAHWLAGRPRRAARSWHRALGEARRYRQGYDELRVLRALQATTPGSPLAATILSPVEVDRLRPHPLVI